MKPPRATAPAIVEGFRSMPDRLAGELERRRALAARAMNYCVTLFDDYFRAILPHDLVLLGAPTGLGKTELALSIAAANARKDLQIHYFALEAEPDELERRTKYATIADELWRQRNPRAGEMNFTDWYLGRCEEFCGHLNEWADRKIAAELSSLYTFYRGRDFNAADLTRKVLEHHEETDLFVLDHLHYVDDDGGEDENRAVTDLVKTIRDVGLRIGRPFLVVAHLRKRDARAQKLVPDTDDFHGSSNITKVCTQIVTLERAFDVEAPKWYLSPTYIKIGKDRRSGSPQYIALTMFDLRLRAYRDTYTLGRATGKKWKEIPLGDAPAWARHHRPLAKDGEASKQEPLHVGATPRRADDDDIPHAAEDPRFTT